LEDLESDKTRGKLPVYETEQDHHVRKMVNNYGQMGGFVGSVGGLCPKIPDIPPRQKKQKKDKPPYYSGSQ
jgi:hypothetical protein